MTYIFTKLSRWIPILLLFLSACQPHTQVLIHSHNDYSHAHPFWGAYRERANSIEADVFPVNGELMVAHSKEAIRDSHTLVNMYLDPIIKLFKKHHNKTVSDDPDYTFYLMIDIKEKWDTVLPLLIKKLKQHPDCFNRQINPKAVQIFISGERPPIYTFHDYPPEIMFDGLPDKEYSHADLKKIVMISTNFQNYASWNGTDTLPSGDAQNLRKVIDEAHGKHKPMRFWGAPDTPDCWNALISLGADVLNTDKVKACKEFLKTHEK